MRGFGCAGVGGGLGFRGHASVDTGVDADAKGTIPICIRSINTNTATVDIDLHQLDQREFSRLQFYTTTMLLDDM